LPADVAAQMAVNENKANENNQNVAVTAGNSNERNAPTVQTTTEKSIEEMHEKSKENNTTSTELNTNAVAKSESPTDNKEVKTEVEKTAASSEPKSDVNKSQDLASSNNATVAIAGLVFKVQVCATHRTVDAAFVKANYKLPEDVMQEMHEGWFKFTVGGYQLYSEARNKRENLAPFNLPGPFVTAYNNGNRITVQEALMISKQQWVK